jgi:hypothetical protein
MKCARHILIALFAEMLLAGMACSPLAAAQARNLSVSNISAPRGAAEGQLTVTLTIVPSVGVVMDENGQPKLIVANAADSADNVSALNLVHLVDAPQLQQSKNKKPRK